MYLLILNTLLEFAWSRYRLVHMCSWRSRVNGPCYAPNTGFGSPCNMWTVTVEIWVMNVLTMPLHLGYSDLPPATMLPPAGFIITLTLLYVLMVVTISARSWNVCSTLEQMQRHHTKIGVSVVFTIGFIVFLVHLTRIFVSLVILLSAFFLRMGTLFSRTTNGKLFVICLYRAEF